MPQQEKSLTLSRNIPTRKKIILTLVIVMSSLIIIVYDSKSESKE